MYAVYGELDNAVYARDYAYGPMLVLEGWAFLMSEVPLLGLGEMWVPTRGWSRTPFGELYKSGSV